MSPWRPGDTVVLRYFGHGRPTGALPTRVIATDDGPVLWVAPGTIVKWPSVRGRHVREVPLEERLTAPRGSIERPWIGEGVLIVGRPGRAHAIWLMRNEGRFANWYVNLEAPWRPFRFGFDTQDHILDLVVGADRSWRWKDEDELAVAVDLGAVTREQAAAFRAEGERVIAEWPFPTGWEDWQPDPAWPLTTVPAEWAE